MRNKLQQKSASHDSSNSPGNGLNGSCNKPDLKVVMRLYIFIFVLLLTFGSLAQTMHFEIGMIVTQVVLILLPAIVFLQRYRVDMVQFSRLYPLQIKYVPTIVILAASMWALNMIVAAGLVTGLMEYGYEPIAVLDPPATFQEYLMLLLVLSVFAGICEEVLFRGTIMPSMEEHGLVPAIVFSSLLFALFHITFLNLVTTFILGIVMAVVVIKTGSLWGGILYHMLNNFIAATYLYFAGQQEAASEVDPQDYWVLLPLGIIALVGSYFSLRLLQKQSNREPLLKTRKNWLPRGWFSRYFVIAVILFLIMALLEFAIGFNWLGLTEL